MKEMVLKKVPNKNVVVSYGDRRRFPARNLYSAHIWVHDNRVEKNHAPENFPFDVGELIDRKSIERFFVEKEPEKEPVQNLNQETIRKAVVEMRKAHRARYGTKLNKEMTGYITKRKTYDLEHMLCDLEFVLVHLHIED